MIRKLRQKLAELDLHCFQKGGIKFNKSYMHSAALTMSNVVFFQ